MGTVTEPANFGTAAWYVYLPAGTFLPYTPCPTYCGVELALLRAEVAALRAQMAEERAAAPRVITPPAPAVRVGDLVRYRGTLYPQLHDLTGVVRVIAALGSSAGVEWATLTLGHSLDGQSRRPKAGWWVSLADLVLV